MISSSCSVSDRFEQLHASGSETSWIGCDLSANQAAAHARQILLVDDDELLRASLRMILELDGHHVTEARNGAEALNSFKISEFDLVITDFEMPVMDGSELATSLKLLAPEQPILMITGSGGARSNAENPVDALLGKPFTVSELRSALDNLLSPGLTQLNATPCYETKTGTDHSVGRFAARLN